MNSCIPYIVAHASALVDARVYDGSHSILDTQPKNEMAFRIKAKLICYTDESFGKYLDCVCIKKGKQKSLC